MRGENPHFRAAHEAPGTVTRPRAERILEARLRDLREGCRMADRNDDGSGPQQDHSPRRILDNALTVFPLHAKTGP